MTPADLDALLIQNDEKACIAFFANMSEKERKSLAQRAHDWLKLLTGFAQTELMSRWWVEGFASDRQRKEKEDMEALKASLPKEAIDMAHAECCKIAAVATANFSELKRFGEEAVPMPDNAYAVLSNRKPNWLDKWMKLVLEEKPFTHWSVIRRFEKDGLAQAPEDANYWSGMAMRLPAHPGGLVQAFEDDHEMSEFVWKMLEDERAMLLLSGYPQVPTNRQIDRRGWMNNRDGLNLDTGARRRTILKFAADGWMQSFPQLVATGKLSKEKLYEQILYWITRLGSEDQKSSISVEVHLTWFDQVHTSIVTDELRKQNVHRLVGMLSSRNTASLQWALKQLEYCDTKQLPIGDVSSAMGNLFRIKGKDHAAEALSLLKKMSEASGADKKQISIIALEGLEHNSTEIHKKSLDLIEKLGAAADADVAQELKGRLPSLSGLLRERAENMVRKALPDDAAREEVSDQGNDSLDDLEQRIAALDDHSRKLAGIDDALNAYREGLPCVKALSFSTYEAPRLDDACKIDPINNVDDLMFQLIQAFEGNADSEKLELIMDGLSRLCNHEVETLQERLKPMRDKLAIGGAISAGAQAFAFVTGHYASDMVALAIAWCDGRTVYSDVDLSFTGLVKNLLGMALSSNQHDNQTTANFFKLRTKALAARIAKRIALPMLCAPTHKGGWVDPRVLVERMRIYEQAKSEIDPADFIQALLRITPDGRADALAASANVSGEVGAALRFALGGERSGALSKPEFWVAAARARDPEGDFEFLADKFRDLGPDSALRARYKRCFQEMQRYTTGEYYWGTTQDGSAPKPILEILPAPSPRDARPWFPTELLHQSNFHSGREISALTWPQLQESFLALELQIVLVSLDSQSSLYSNRKLSMLFDPDVNASGFMCPLIALGLAAKNAETTQYFEDALITGIEDGRVDGAIFGAAASEHIYKAVTQTRWIKAFKNVAKVSPLHAQVIRTSLEAILVAEPESPIKFLELLYELCLEAREPVCLPELTTYLQTTANTKGKAATLAKQLLKLDASNAAASRKAASLYALRNRIERAERYQRTRAAALNKLEVGVR